MSTTPHDSLFKAIFSRLEHAASVLRAVLPPRIAARIDFGALVLVPGSFIDEDLAASHTDLLFSATFSGHPLLIYVLFEHQSTFDPWMPLRLLRYMLRIWDAYRAAHPQTRCIPLILPVVLHHSARGWQGTVAFEDLFDVDPDTLSVFAPYIPGFRFILEDISFETDEALRTRAMTALARLALWCLRHAREPDELLESFFAWTELVREVLRAPNGGAAFALVLEYILTVSDRPPEEVLPRLFAATGAEIREEIVSTADMLREEGRLKGWLEGRTEGRTEGQRSMLLKLLAIRFGDLPEAALRRVQEADTLHLDSWAERVLTAASLPEVLGES